MATFDLPHPGFHFLVFFQLFPQFPHDVRFQEVSGLNAEIVSREIPEGGAQENIKHVPCCVRYADLSLKRGKFLGSGVLHWFTKTMENINQNNIAEVPTTNILISLLDENHLPLYNWFVKNARPKRLNINAFNAEQNSIVVEEMVFTYESWTYYDPVHTTLGALGL